MNLWLLAAGIGVIALVSYDVFVTTVSAVSPGGPISQRLGLGIWRLLRTVARSPASPLLTAAGPAIVFLLLSVWLLGLWAGWTLVFSAEPSAVVQDRTGVPADGWSRAYFAGFSVYTLGVGDYVPRGAPWQVLTALATLNGFVLLTMTVSYLIPVVMAVSERRQRGMALHALGSNAQQMVVNGWDGVGFEELRGHLHRLAPLLDLSAQQYLSYPVLHFFHSPTREHALEPGIAALDEAILLLEHGVAPTVRLHTMVTGPVRGAMERFAEVVSTGFVTRSVPTPPLPSLAPLRNAGIPTVDDATFARAVADRQDHRRRMAAVVADARWTWTASVEAPKGP